MYFLDIFALITIVGMGFGSPGTIRWFVGLCAAIMSLFTMGSGLLASLAVVGLVVLHVLKQKKINRDELVAFACALAVFAAGLLLNVTVEQDKQFQAKSVFEFLAALMSYLAWPFWKSSPHAVFHLPAVDQSSELNISSPASKKPGRLNSFLAFAFWGFLQSAALAYGRGGGMSSRYMDTLSVISIAEARQACW